MWSPLAPPTLVDDTLTRIAHDLKARAQDTPGQPGLLVGRAGLALFFLYYARFTGKPDDQSYAEALVADLFESLPESVPFTFCSGLAGVAWLLRHAVSRDLLQADADEALDDADALLRDRLATEMREGSFDFLHGALGCALYLMEGAEHPPNRAALITLVGDLERHAIDDLDGMRWRNRMVEVEEGGADGISLGLSHGMPSVISALSRLIALDVEPVRSAAMLDKAVRFLLNQEMAGAGSGARYRAMAGTTAGRTYTEPSRLAWCYGDPGIASALWQAGRARGRDDWTGKAHALIEHSATRRTPGDTRVSDASLCHGSAGLALIFARMHEQTGSAPLREAALYWLNETLAMSRHDDGYAGFKATMPPGHEDAAVEVSVLNGIAGIGLALMALTSRHEPAWDRGLLLS